MSAIFRPVLFLSVLRRESITYILGLILADSLTHMLHNNVSNRHIHVGDRYLVLQINIFPIYYEPENLSPEYNLL